MAPNFNPPLFERRDSAFETADLVWWLPRSSPIPEGWFDLDNHSCNGFVLDHLDGWVSALNPSPAGLKLLEAIAAEDFAKVCDAENLDYEVTMQHRSAYSRYLSEHGLEPGDMKQLVQAVYPLAATLKNLVALGIDTTYIPLDASLLVLGTNCD